MSEPARPDPTRPRNPFFPLAAFSSVLFIVTILALVAGVFGDPRAPLAQLLDRYAGRLLAGEVAAILVTGFLAMFVDRRQTKRSQKDSVHRPRMSSKIQAQIERLRDEPIAHNYLYHVAARPEISDLDFDRLLKRLTELETQHPEYDSPDSPSHKSSVGRPHRKGFVSVAASLSHVVD